MNGLEDISERTYARTHARTYGRDSLGLQRLRRETKNGRTMSRGRGVIRGLYLGILVEIWLVE